MSRFAALLGIAFQIQDDVLNLESNPRYGKEEAGDLWEGKRTLILLHSLKRMAPHDRQQAQEILSLPRDKKQTSDIQFLLEQIAHTNSLSYARNVALHHAKRSRMLMQQALGLESPNVHRQFLEDLIDYVVRREW
jgi:geranylgeranyl diphosphate synthase type II